MPNLVICGTPGTGKSTLIDKLKAKLKEFNFINLSKFAIDEDCIIEYDELLESQVLDEPKLLDRLNSVFDKYPSNIIESIHSDLLPADRIDWVFVCRTDNTMLYDRLKARGYNELKISNNIQAEIFQSILDETSEAFDDSIITQLTNNEESDLVSNLEVILDKVRILSST